jgi:hypothetical protein
VIYSPTPTPDPPDGDDDDGDRPTVLPPFDADAFARDSEVRLRAADPGRGETTTDEAHRLLLEGRAEEALFLLSRMLEVAPLDVDARRLFDECGAALERDCWSVVGSHSTVLSVAVSPAELRDFALDHVSGFLVSRLDGVTDVETLLDISGLPRLLALRHLRGLVSRGIVAERRRA